MDEAAKRFEEKRGRKGRSSRGVGLLLERVTLCLQLVDVVFPVAAAVCGAVAEDGRPMSETAVIEVDVAVVIAVAADADEIGSR